MRPSVFVQENIVCFAHCLFLWLFIYFSIVLHLLDSLLEKITWSWDKKQVISRITQMQSLIELRDILVFLLIRPAS